MLMMTLEAWRVHSQNAAGGIVLLVHQLETMKAWQARKLFQVTWQQQNQHEPGPAYQVLWVSKRTGHQRREQLTLRRSDCLSRHPLAVDQGDILVHQR